MSGYKDLTSPNKSNLYCQSLTSHDGAFSGTLFLGPNIVCSIQNLKVNTSFSGPWASPQSCLISYGLLSDSIVVAYFPSTLATGTSATYANTLSGAIPLDMRPSTNLIVPMYTVVGNGVSNIGACQINSDGTLIVYGTVSTHSFATGTSVGWDHTVVTWKRS